MATGSLVGRSVEADVTHRVAQAEDVDGTEVSRTLETRFENLVGHTAGTVNVHSYGSTGTHLAAAAAAATAAGRELVIAHSITVSTAVGTISCPVRMVGAGRLVTATGGSVTLTGPFVSDLSHRFDTSAGGTITFSAQCPEVYPQWWGAVGDGTTDDLLPLRAAVAASAGKTLRIPGTANSYLISADVDPPSDCTILGDGTASTVIKLASGDIHGLLVTSKSRVTIRDLRILGETDGTNAYIGGITLYQSDHCVIDNIELVGLVRAGVLVWDSSYNTISRVRTSAWTAYHQNSAGVNIFRNSHYNGVCDCHLYEGADTGVAIVDDYVGATPTGNVVTGNHIGAHDAYGIMLYIAGSGYDTRTVISDNEVYGTLGRYNVASGAGIYIQTGCGAVVTGNVVTNSCQESTNFDTLAAAGIGVTIPSSATPLPPVIVAKNRVISNRGPGIAVNTSGSSVIVEGNAITTDNSTADTSSYSIRVSAAPYCKVRGNTINHTSSIYDAIYAQAVISCPGIEIEGNTVVTSAQGLRMINAGSGGFTDARIAGNTILGATSYAAWLANITGGVVEGNTFTATETGYYQDYCTNLAVSGNRITGRTSGGYGIICSHTNTGTVIDESNQLVGIIENDAGNGTMIIQYGTAAPTAGIFDVGDRVIARAPSVGTPKAWRCTATGYPGTWTSEGNL